MEPLMTVGVQVYYGQYQGGEQACRRGENSWTHYIEKMTDVNIASHMVIDAINKAFDTAILISGDSDLVPPIQAIHQNFTYKRIVVAFPPRRARSAIKSNADACFVLGRSKLLDCHFPDVVVNSNGYKLKWPSEWR